MAVKEFNELLLEFLAQLAEVFPEIPLLELYSKVAAKTVKEKPDTPPKLFLSSTAQHAWKIANKDETFFDDCPVLLNINIRDLWKKDLSEQTRQTIWTYLMELQRLATATALPPKTMDALQQISTALPPQTLNALNEIAKDMSSQVEQGKFDPYQLLSLLGMKQPQP